MVDDETVVRFFADFVLNSVVTRGNGGNIPLEVLNLAVFLEIVNSDHED